MRFVSRSLRAGIFLIVPAFWFVLILGRGTAEPSAPPAQRVVELQDVKYNGLVEAVKAQRGKVVVVDVWATWCPPCVKNYPHVLKMQKEYGSQGLVCISVSVDFPKDKDNALKFLKAKDSTIQNFRLDESAEFWAGRWAVNGPPVLFVFDRAGRRAFKFGTEDNPASVDGEINPDIEKRVKELLQAKP